MTIPTMTTAEESSTTISCVKDYRVVLYGLFSCIHYGWDVYAGGNHQWYNAMYVIIRFSIHIFLLSLCYTDERPHTIGYIRIITAMLVLLGVIDKFQQMPEIWDSDSWGIQMDTTFSLWLIVHSLYHDKSKTTITKTTTLEYIDSTIFATIRDMFANYYFAAAFWKINSHFLDPNSSCATMFIIQLITNYIRPIVYAMSSSPQDTLISIAKMSKVIAPSLALILELAVGGCMVYGSLVSFSRRDNIKLNISQSIGSLLALLFHFMVCLLPAPNDISGFALNCAPRHIAFTTAYGTYQTMKLCQRYALQITTIIVVGTAIGIQNEWTENNWAFFWYVFVGGFVATAILSDFVVADRTVDCNENSSNGEITKNTNRRPFWSYLAVSIAFFYSFITLVLGIQEESTANMFSNLKAGHGGSNHYLLPTGLLFHWYANAPSTHPFGGGVIRIESTSSDWFRTIYPADFTHFLQPDGIVDVMESIGIKSPIYFNPGANRNLGLILAVPKVFYRYTVPALEFKRLLYEAKIRDQNFVLTYSKLPGTSGDEIWRTTATENVVRIHVENGQMMKCQLRMTNQTMWKNCDASELPYVDYQKTIPWIIRHMSMYHAYPIAVNDVSMIPPSIKCFGP